jgi:hypothetical protein
LHGVKCGLLSYDGNKLDFGDSTQSGRDNSGAKKDEKYKKFNILNKGFIQLTCH